MPVIRISSFDKVDRITKKNKTENLHFFFCGGEGGNAFLRN